MRDRILHVLKSLPSEVQQDFLADPRFSISLDNYSPGKGSQVFLAAPGAEGNGSRNVVLRPRLEEVLLENFGIEGKRYHKMQCSSVPKVATN